MIQKKSGETSFLLAVDDGIALIAKLSASNRVSLFHSSEGPGGPRFSRVYLWEKQTGGSVPAPGRLKDFSYAALPSRWQGLFVAGSCANGSTGLFSNAGALLHKSCLCVLAAPVHSGTDFWGFVLFEKFVEDYFTDAETDILRSAGPVLAGAFIRGEEATALREAHARVRLMLDAVPLGCFLWDENRRVVDCNEAAVRLFGFESKSDCVENFMLCCPEYQPDGRRSDEKAELAVDRAFEEGRFDFDWLHQMPDGTPIPARVALVRVENDAGPAVAGYTQDLRAIRAMEANILRLECEVEKIYYDPLTAIYNRRYFDKKFGDLLTSLSRCGGVLSLMMVDIDFFKQYNDVYGHVQGDKCLRLIAQTLTGCTQRHDDFAARYGGEEFVVVLPHSAEEGARILAEKLLSDIRALGIPHSQSTVSACVTVSVGVVTGNAVRRPQRKKEFVERADKMLYEAKQGGRNRCAFTAL